MTDDELAESHSVNCGVNAGKLDDWYGPCDCIVSHLVAARERIKLLEAMLENEGIAAP